MSTIDELIKECLQLKNEYDLLKNQIDDIRLRIFNELTNLQKDSYENNEARVTKINDYEYLSVSKESLFNAIDSANLTDSQKQIFLNTALNEIYKNGYVVIKAK